MNAHHSETSTDSRISITRCREILGDDAPESDEEIKAIRDALYSVAHVALQMAVEFAPCE